MEQDLAHKAVRNTLFNGVRLVAPFVAAVFKSAIIARTLGPDKMGLFSYGVWFAAILGVLAFPGLNPAMAKYLPEFIGQEDQSRACEVARRVIALQLLVSLVAAALCVALASLFVKGAELAVVGIAALILIPTTGRDILNSVLVGWQRYDKIAVVGLKSAIPEVGLVVLAAALGSGVDGMLAATLGGVLVSGWLTLRAVQPMLGGAATVRMAVPRMQDSMRRVRKFAFAESYLVVLDAVIWSRSEIFFLKHFSALSEVALFGIAYALAEKVWIADSSLLDTLMPLSSEAVARSGMEAVAKIYESALKYIQILTVPAILAGIVLSEPLIRLVYGTKYLAMTPVLQLLLVALIFTPLGGVSEAVMAATEKQNLIAKCETPVAFLNIALALALIPKAGAVGAAVAKCVTHAVLTVVLLAFAGKAVSGRFPFAATAKIYVSALAGVAPLYLTRRAGAGILMLGASVIAGGLIYLSALVGWGEIERREFAIFHEALGRPFASRLSRNTGTRSAG